MTSHQFPPKQGLYDPQFEHDACGVGFVVQMKGLASHDIVQQGLQILCNLEHRGACGSEVNTGDGAGILVQLPHRFLVKAAAAEGIALPDAGEYGVGLIFTSPDATVRAESRRRFESVTAQMGQKVLGWRDVPTDDSTLGATAQLSEPFMQQVFIARGADLADDLAFERKLYVIRKLAYNAIGKTGHDTYWYPASLSCRTMVYKGMLTPPQVKSFFPDLSDPDFESALALVHSRFSTNTFPSWERSHPYRYIAHNGEINTLRGNTNWMIARQSMFESALFGDDMAKVKPVININGSDSTIFDNALELLVLAGRSLPHAVMMMVPEPWTGHESMDDASKAFYEYHACLMEPWDGPASVAFTDGSMIGAVLDRNGLRPSRYYVTKDDRVIMASEAGVLPVEPDQVLEKGRLQPGRMFLVDMAAGRIVGDEEVKSEIVNAQPYRQWLDQHQLTLSTLAPKTPQAEVSGGSLRQRQMAFGYTFEELRMLLTPMAQNGVEAIGSMGTDTPLAVLSDKPKLLYDYFQQLFAQVTNPPIDSIREAIITSAVTTVGSERNLLDPQPESCRLIQLKTPVIGNDELAKLQHIDESGFAALTLPILFDPKAGVQGLESAMESIFERVDGAISTGTNLIVLSDRGMDATQAPIPALLAVAGLHHHLIRTGTRTHVGIILESGEPREVHHFAVLLGYGCNVIN
ncbi:MAG: glutamate synthase central domain-containing protein, partial [Cyanobacteria bacterium J06636_28]